MAQAMGFAANPSRMQARQQYLASHPQALAQAHGQIAQGLKPQAPQQPQQAASAAGQAASSMGAQGMQFQPWQQLGPMPQQFGAPFQGVGFGGQQPSWMGQSSRGGNPNVSPELQGQFAPQPPQQYPQQPQPVQGYYR